MKRIISEINKLKWVDTDVKKRSIELSIDKTVSPRKIELQCNLFNALKDRNKFNNIF